MSVGILDRLRRRGTAVPEEVSVVGFDDVPAANYVSPAMTTIQVALDLLGRIAVDLLIAPDTVPDAIRQHLPDARLARRPRLHRPRPGGAQLACVAPSSAGNQPRVPPSSPPSKSRTPRT